jgi:hypothetical protein
MKKTSSVDLSVLWIHLDEITDGALYCLRHECETTGWKPHLWSQTPEEGGPFGLTRFIFLGVDDVGVTKYFDTVLVHDPTGMATQVKNSETVLDASRTAKKTAEAILRAEMRYPEVVRSLN